MAAVRLIGLSFVATAGLAGLAADRWPAYLPVSPQALHRIFGVLLLSMVVMSFRAGVSGERLNDVDARAFCRRLSRGVYLVLYFLFGAEQIVRAGWHAAALQPPENLRDYFAYGLLAQLTIRALAALSVRRPPAAQMSPRLAPAEGAAAPQ